MKVLKVRDYNDLQGIEYDKRCKEWTPEQGGFPQAAFYFFSNHVGRYAGLYRLTGYVAYDEHKAILRDTKSQAVAAFNK